MLLKVYSEYKEYVMDIKQQVGCRVRQLRLENGVSQEQLSFEIGLDRTYLSGVENGKRNISIINLQKVWKFFNLTPSQFFDREFFK